MGQLPIALVCFFLGLASFGDCVSSAGRTFYQAFNHHDPVNDPNATRTFILSTEATTCKVDITIDMPPLTTYSVTISKGQPLLHEMNVNASRGIKLEAPCDFVAYGMNFNPYAAEGWMAIPLESLGTEYAILGVGIDTGHFVELSIIATSDNTACTLTFPNRTQLNVTLNAMQVKNFISTSDFTGTTVVCNNKVSIITGHQCGYFPNECQFCNHLVEQIPPKPTLGRNFALVPMNQGCNKQPTCCKDPQFCAKCFETYVILALENETQVVRSGTETSEVFTMQAGESKYLLLSQKELSHLTSSKPVIVGQYLNGNEYQSSELANPAFTIVPQIESYKQKYLIATCLPQFTQNFVNLVVKAKSSSQLLLNGQPFLTAANPKSIPGTDFEAIQYQFDCSHSNNQTLSFTIEHSQNATFGLLAFGLGFFSYAYPAGMSFCNLPQISVTSDIISEACHLTIAFPDFTDPITWTDDQCCYANSTLTFEDTLIEYTPCIKTIVRTWTLTDGCGRLVQANQTAIIKRKLDVYNAPPSRIRLTGQSNEEFIEEPELIECCGTTLSIELDYASDEKAYTNRTWIITHECTDEKTIFNQTFTCAPGFNHDQRQCGCVCGHHNQGRGSGQLKKSSLKEWWQIGVFEGAKEVKKSHKWDSAF